MKDIEYLFNKEVYERKRVGRGAYAKINGSKSRKCSLPHDGLSEAKLRKLNGPCKTFSMNRPCTWVELKSMPDDLAADYLYRLKNTYHVSQRHVAEMLGVAKNTLASWMIAKDIHFPKKCPYPNAAELAAWERFCAGEAEEHEVEDYNEAVHETMDETTDETVDEPKFEEAPVLNRTVVVKGGAATLVGGGAQLAEYIYSLLGNRMAEITMEYRFIGTEGAEK